MLLRTADKNMQLREGHEALKRDTQAAFDDARSLQARWHQHVVPAQAEAYKVGSLHRCDSVTCNADAVALAPPVCHVWSDNHTRTALRSQRPARSA